jgi:hypothetical protein
VGLVRRTGAFTQTHNRGLTHPQFERSATMNSRRFNGAESSSSGRPRPNWRTRIHALLCLLLSAFCLSSPTYAQNASATDAFGGRYSSLKPEQKRLVDDWFKRFSAVVKKPVNPAEGYDKLPVSGRTTFNAVTHALMMTRLTDDSGKSLAGSAIEMVDRVDGAAGQILGARGDEQFRIYVQMKPGAIALLNQSREFKRVRDNTIYHKGYPTCYRTKGVPSIQVSLTHDAARADIDVDYRSSKFPSAFVNGHLSAANSDVRAGDNDARHNNQWAGLQNWWRNLLGLPFVDTESFRLDGRVLAQEPIRKDMKPAEAIFDFLNGWLVEQTPNESIAYIADEAFACMELEKRPNADRGMATFVTLQNMFSANKRIGKVSLLRDVSSAVTLTGERVRPIEQPHQAEFAMYDVREDLAEEFNCANQLDSAQVSAKAAKSDDFGKYVGAVFRIHSKDQPGNTVATLWRKQHGYWKIVSYEIDPELDRSAIPNVGVRRPAVPPLSYVDGDKDMIKAASDFLKLWFLKKDIDKAVQYVAPECLVCVNIYRSDDTEAASSDDRSRESLKRGMAKAAAGVGKVKRLNDALIAPELHHEDLKLVKHADNRAFVIASIPDYMGEAARCDRRNADGEPGFSPSTGPASYGTYYASGFNLNQGKTSPAVLWIVWRRVHEVWRAVSYILVTP